MACRVEFRLTIHDLDNHQGTPSVYEGAATYWMTVPPAIGIHLGTGTLLTVALVNYTGIADGTDKDRYLVHLATISTGQGFDSIPDICTAIRECTPWLEWDFVLDQDDTEILPDDTNGPAV